MKKLKKYKQSVINSFSGEYEWLSNFYPSRVMGAGMSFPSVEHAYQAYKTFNDNERRRIATLTAGQAKRAGNKLKLRSDWEEVKEELMYELVLQKFETYSKLRRKLLDTKDAILIEGNNWGDRYWGVCNGVGQNKLGEILMRVRKEIGGM